MGWYRFFAKWTAFLESCLWPHYWNDATVECYTSSNHRDNLARQHISKGRKEGVEQRPNNPPTNRATERDTADNKFSIKLGAQGEYLFCIDKREIEICRARLCWTWKGVLKRKKERKKYSEKSEMNLNLNLNLIRADSKNGGGLAWCRRTIYSFFFFFFFV